MKIVGWGVDSEVPYWLVISFQKIYFQYFLDVKVFKQTYFIRLQIVGTLIGQRMVTLEFYVEKMNVALRKT